MKITVEIADDLFERVQRVVRQEKTTFRALTEQGLRLVLNRKDVAASKWKWQPLTVAGKGKSKSFKNASWDKMRDEIYTGRSG